MAIDASGFDHTAAGAHENLGPTRASRAMAIVHIAMHDAIQSIQHKYETFIPEPSAPVGASIPAAAAQASHDTLVALYPAQTASLDTELAAELATVPNGQSKTDGIAAGATAATNILANRASDGSDSVTQGAPYTFGQNPGQWRVDPINPTQTPLGANWGLVKPFAMLSASQFRAPAPPALTDPAYTTAYNEVKAFGGDGITTATQRTPDETQAGIYWAYDGTPSLCAPTRLYNQLIGKVLLDNGITDQGETARVLALANIAMGDAAIAAWETKFFYNFWRPICAIRESDAGTGPSGLGDGNPNTFGNPTWTPLGAPASNLSTNNFTPPFPGYVSGHATFGGAMFQVLRDYFHRDNIRFTFVSDEFNGVTKDNHGVVRPLIPRSFSSFSQAENENGQSRIYLGIHFSFDKIEGIAMGNKVASWVDSHLLKRLPIP